MSYIVITEWKTGKSFYGDANVKYETEDIKAAKEAARMFAKDDPDDAHTFITTRDEWEDGNYDEIDF